LLFVGLPGANQQIFARNPAKRIKIGRKMGVALRFLNKHSTIESTTNAQASIAKPPGKPSRVAFFVLFSRKSLINRRLWSLSSGIDPV
jgi:hypothetical protein